MSQSPPANAVEQKGLAQRILAKLHRTTASGLYIPEIDGFRTVAILMVVFFHLRTFVEKVPAYTHPLTRFEQSFYDLLKHGNFGVEVFFAVSGFIISLPFAAHFLTGGRRVGIGKFYLRRVTRLEPPYILNLLFSCVVRHVVDKLGWAFIAERFLASMFYMSNFVYGDYSIINPVAWSLEIEFQFYFIAPLLLSVLAVRDAWVRRLLVAGLPILVILLRPEGWRVHNSLLGMIEYFAIGALLCDIYLTTWKGQLPRWKSYNWPAVIFSLDVVVALLLPTSPWVSVLRAVCLFFAMWTTLASTWLSSVLRNPWIATFGGMCYTIYLYHSTIISAVVRATRRLTYSNHYLVTYGLQLVLCLTAVTIICSFLFYWTEKPFMDRGWFKKWLNFFPSLFGRSPAPVVLAVESRAARSEH